ncbi:MAG: hypothetical protein K2P86_10025 [Xanthobacteraceae bacterium]|nr:hypothetical protein [Xanthobacteraceae bacterium]
MRFAPIFALLAGFSILAASAYEVEAQQLRERQPRVIVKKRSYLDAGTEVKPLSKNYHSHIFDNNWQYSTLGPDNTGARIPLPRMFDLPNF